MRTLLFHNADVNAKDADGRSTLYILALENRLTMARFLLEHANADVESRDSEVSNSQLIRQCNYIQLHFTDSFDSDVRCTNKFGTLDVHIRCTNK